MNNHTPKAWISKTPTHAKHKECRWITKGKDQYIAKVYGNTGKSPASPEEVDANARLIAAAPDLLHAAQIGLRYAPDIPGAGKQTIIRAINKATGQPIMSDEQLTARYRLAYSAWLLTGDKSTDETCQRTADKMRGLGFGDNYLEAIRNKVETEHREVL